jgi:hypothetical protein
MLTTSKFSGPTVYGIYFFNNLPKKVLTPGRGQFTFLVWHLAARWKSLEKRLRQGRKSASEDLLPSALFGPIRVSGFLEI